MLSVKNFKYFTNVCKPVEVTQQSKPFHQSTIVDLKNVSTVGDPVFHKKNINTHEHMAAIREFASLPPDLRATYAISNDDSEAYVLLVLTGMYETLRAKESDNRVAVFHNLMRYSQDEDLRPAIREELCRMISALKDYGAFCNLE